MRRCGAELGARRWCTLCWCNGEVFMHKTILALLPLLIAIPAGAQDDHWSLQPVRVYRPPQVVHTSWPRSDLDRFVLRRLEAKKLQPVADALPETLIRRAYFNLVGLPPTPEQIEAFRHASRQDADAAFENLVDRLLASPQFGEKWARHWLDLARFAESNGKDRDVVFPEAWRYRDYVIDAFNNDKPFDTFIREQIAGDLIPDRDDDQLIATGFLALGAKAFQEVDNEKFTLDVVDEQIDVLTRSILGLTVACARCHDHKYDPIASEDYYALAGILISSDLRYGPGPLYFARHDKDTDLVPIGDRARELDPAVQQWRGEILSLTEKVTGLRSAAYRIQRNIAGALRERELEKADEADDLAAEEKKMLRMRAEADAANAKRLQMIRTPPNERPGYAMAVLHSQMPPQDCAVRFGGVHTDRGRAVPRGSMKIPGMPEFGSVAHDDSGRRQLASWLAAADNPLTARVIVNRVWHHLFGTGLVRTVDNFGVTGDPPSHPELLDHLASRFIADGWSVKRLIRRVVLSRTWRMSSAHDASNEAIDADNRYLWHANFRRLDVEAFRDSVLAVSGSLITQPPRGSLFADVYAGTDYGEPNDHRANFDADIAADLHRTVYLPIARNSVPDFLGLFDFADPTVTTGARNSRTIPAQALFLMNGPFMERQSRLAAERILKLPISERLQSAWILTTARQPSRQVAEETERWLRQRTQDSSELQAWTDLMQILFASAAFRYIM